MSGRQELHSTASPMGLLGSQHFRVLPNLTTQGQLEWLLPR
jgi:hypothetical protein